MDIFPGAHALFSKTRSDLILQRTCVSCLYVPRVTSSRKRLFLVLLPQRLEQGSCSFQVAACHACCLGTSMRSSWLLSAEWGRNEC